MHAKFGFHPSPKPNFLIDEVMKMRLNFMLEELKETAMACGYALADDPDHGFIKTHSHKNLPEALDGLLDLEVVLHGTAHLMGFASHVPPKVKSRYATIWSEGQDRVFQANMAKRRCAPGEVGKRGSNLDLIKPEGWKAPTFGDLLQ